MHKEMTARSKRGSAIPGMASRNLPDRNGGFSITARQWSAGAARASRLGAAGLGLEGACVRPYLASHHIQGEHTMTIQVGERLPDVPLTIAGAEGPQPTTAGEFFAGKRVALFAVPGAFTPTCSARPLPSFVDKASELKGR